MSRVGSTFILLVVCGASALAGPITYTFNAPISAGSFTYDAQAPVGAQFSSFILNLGGYTWDLTGVANTGPSRDGVPPDPCGTTIDSISSFGLLNGALCGAGAVTTWNANLLFVTAFLELNIQLGPEKRTLSLSQSSGFSSGPLFPLSLGGGSFSVAANGPSPAPEPSAYLLAMLGLAGLAARGLRARNTR